MDAVTLGIAKKYVDETANGLGAVKGAPCTIKSITEGEDGSTIVFSWTGADGTEQTGTTFLPRGPQGLPGKKGDPGEPGKDGSGTVDTVARQQIAGKPLVYIDGVIPTTKNEVLAELWYEHGPERWHAYITIKCQGNTSMVYDKKNFTIKLYSDEARTVKLKKKMFGWPMAYHKYVLKANWVDHTHARNIVTANIGAEIVASRPDYDTLPEELRNSPNNGAIDGHPIIVYTNGNYQGVYTWNIGKDDWMWGMDEDNPNHVLLCAETNTDFLYIETPCNFRALWSGVHEQDWSVEVGTNSEAVKNSLNALISCVKDTDDATFRSTIGNHLDVLSAIDYFLLACADCGIDSLGKNMIIGTYNLKKWRLGPYDLDATWLMWFNGQKFLDANRPFPWAYQEKNSLLLERLVKLYPDEMYVRGKQLRKTVLSYANIMSHFEPFCASIGKEAYADDLVPYPAIPSADTNNIWQLRNAVRDRLAYFDKWLESLYDTDHIFKLHAETKFETKYDLVGVNINFLDADRDWTMLIDMTPGVQPENSSWVCKCESKQLSNEYPKAGLRILLPSGDEDYDIIYRGRGENYMFRWHSNIARGTTTRSVMVIRHAKGSGTYELYSHNGTDAKSESQSLNYHTSVSYELQRLEIGANALGLETNVRNDATQPWVGTMHRFEIYERYYSDEEIEAFVAGAIS